MAFRSVLQGDHGGVDFATSAHSNLLIEHDVLHDGSRLLADRPMKDEKLAQGLVIDDYLNVEVLDENVEKEKARSWKLHEKAALAYRKAGLLGSPEKDLWGEEKGKIIGAFLDSSSSTRAQGIVSLGAPPPEALCYVLAHFATLPTSCYHRQFASLRARRLGVGVTLPKAAYVSFAA